MLKSRNEIELSIVLAAMDLKEIRKEIFEELDSNYFAYEKCVFNELKNMYVKNKYFTKKDSIYIIENLDIEFDKINLYKQNIDVSKIQIRNNIEELKQIYINEKLNALAKNILNGVGSNCNPEDLIFEMKKVIDNLNYGPYSKEYYKKKKSGELYVDKAKFAEWIKDKFNIINDEVNSARMYSGGVYNEVEESQLKKIILENLNGRFRSDMYLIKTTLELIKILPNNIEFEQLDLEENINFKNCILNITNDKIIEHSPKIISGIQLNCDYNRDAKCEKFLQWLKERVAEKDILTIQEMMGYFFIKGVQAQKCFIIHGEGSTGKSTLIKIIEEIIGSKNISNVQIQKLSERFMTARLYNKLVNIFADIPQYGIGDDSVFKPIVTGDRITGEIKNQTPFEFSNSSRLLFSCNKLPRTNDRTYGFFRRCLIITMNNHIDEANTIVDYEKQLLLEKEGIVNWAVEGLKRLISNNFKFTISKETEKNIQEYKDANDSIKLFIKDRCTEQDNAFTSITTFKKEYTEYCKQNYQKAMEEHTIRSYFINNGYEIKKKNNIHVIMGIGLLADV